MYNRDDEDWKFEFIRDFKLINVYDITKHKFIS